MPETSMRITCSRHGCLAHWLTVVGVDVAWVANAPGVHHLIVFVLKQMAAAAAAAAGASLI
jgi:hypothetical protein